MTNSKAIQAIIKEDEALNLKFVNCLKEAGIEVPENYVCEVNNSRIEMVLLDGEGKRVFAGEVNIYFSERFNQPREVELSVGSSGSFNNQTESSVKRYLLTAELIKNWDVFVPIVKRVCEAKENLSKAARSLRELEDKK